MKINTKVEVYIKEIFESIQGEGRYVGQNQLFIRFCNCNLSCKYCDTDFKSKNSKKYNSNLLIEEVKNFDLSKINAISLTGGEPLIDIDFLDDFLNILMPVKQLNGFKIYLETNGTLYLNLEKIINKIDIISMDIKLKSATLNENRFEDNRKFLNIAKNTETFIKVVFNSKITKYEIKNCINLAKINNNDIILQPESNELINYLKNCEFEKKENGSFFEEVYRTFLLEYKNVYLIPQVHKFLHVQ